LILIFGGAYQGKLDYATQRFDLTENDIYRCREDIADVPKHGARLVNELDKWIFALVKAGHDSNGAVKRLVADNANLIVTCNDISCGVVPVDPIQRAWREAVGRALAMIARESEEVVRLFCGIPTKIK